MGNLKPSVASFATKQKRGGSSWDIIVSWPNGSSAVVPGFSSDAEAGAWIATKSAEWLMARQTGSHDKPHKAGA